MELKEYKLGDLIEVTRGMSLPGEFYSTEGKYIRLTCGNFDYVNNSFKENKSKDDLYYVGKIKPEFIMEKGDIITPLTEQAIGLLGSTAIIPESGKYIQSQDVAKVTCKKGMIDHDFAYYLIPSKCVKEQLSAAAQQTKIRHTSPDAIKACKVFVPPLSEQKKIAAVLSALDDKIALNKKMNQELEAMAKRLYDYWFVQYDFPDKNGHPYKTTGGPMTYNPTLKREIPAGWEVKKCSEICRILTGKEDANFASGNGKFKFFTCSSEPSLCDKAAFEGHAVLIAGNGDFNVKHYSGKFNAYQRTYVLIPPDKYYAMLYIAALERIDSFKSGSNGSIVKFITKGDVENICVFDGAPAILYSVINNLIFQYEKISLEIEKLSFFRNKLLPLLMNGQVTVA